MRYEIGQTLFAVHCVFASQNPYGNLLYSQPLIYSDDQPTHINFVKLEVTEHHKVCSEYDDEAKATEYDGYVLKDPKGTTYHNQYPTASYGQITDTGNRRFTNPATREQYELLKGDPTKFVEAHLLTDLFSEIAKGIRDLGEVQLTDKNAPGARNKIAALEALQIRMLNEFKEQFPEYHVFTQEKTLFTGSSFKHFETIIYRDIPIAELKNYTTEQLVNAFKNDEIVKVLFPTGDYLVLEQDIGNYLLWNSIVGNKQGMRMDVESLRVLFAERSEGVGPEDAPGYMVHQTEFFHPSDLVQAVEALQRRGLGKIPYRATSGSSLEVIASRQLVEGLKYGNMDFWINQLKKEGELSVVSSDGMLFKLALNELTNIPELVTIPRHSEEVYTTYLPQCEDLEIAVRTFKKLAPVVIESSRHYNYALDQVVVEGAVVASLADRFIESKKA